METGLEGKPWFYGAGVAALLTGAVVAGGYYAFPNFQDMGNQLVRKEGTLRQLQDQIREGEAAQAQLPQFKEEVERLELELEKLLRILPQRRYTEDLLRRIRNLTEQGDFLLIRFDPHTIAQQDDFYSEWTIQIELQGTYHNLALFFDRISRFSRIINVDNLRITPIAARSAEGRGGHSIKANFVAKTFLSNEPEEPEGDS